MQFMMIEIEDVTFDVYYNDSEIVAVKDAKAEQNLLPFLSDETIEMILLFIF